MKSRIKCLFSLLLIITGLEMAVGSLWPADIGAAETTPISLSGAVYREQEADPGLTDVFLAELSKQSGVNILDQSALKLVFGELSLVNLSDDALNQVRLGKILGVNYFVWVKLSDNLAVLEVVEAATGRGVVVTPFRFEQGKLSNTWPAIAAEAVRAARQGAPPASAKMPSLAMTNPRLMVTNEAVNSATEALLTRLSRELGGEGATVLPRRFTRELVTERWRAEKGLVQSDEQQQLIGSDYILTFTVDGTPPVLEMGLVESKTGHRMGKCRHPLDEAARDNRLTRWIMDRLRPVTQPSVVAPATTNTQVAISETLDAFYKGMVLHNQGYYLDASIVFNAIQGQNAQIKETDRWMESCCRLSGFPEIADEIRSYSTNKPGRNIFIPQPAKQSLLVQAGEGIALLGVMGAPGVPRTITGPLGILLVDMLGENTRTPVLVTEDIAELRNEYDLLLGLENVKGVTWQKAPALLLTKAITAHIQPKADGFLLRLCLVESVDPAFIKEISVCLPVKQSQWRSAVREVVQKLLTDKSIIGWQPPGLIFAESKKQLYDQLKTKFNGWSYLKLLTLDPMRTGGLVGCDEPIRSGLKFWFARTLPKDHPDLPIIEFAAASYSIEHGFGTTNGVARSAEAFRRVADKYPDHPAGLLAGYDTLLCEMDPNNLEKTQVKMSKVLSALGRFESQILDVRNIRKMESALRFALGKPGGQPDNTILFSNFVIPFPWNEPNCKDDRLGLSRISSSPGSWHWPQNCETVFPRTREKMRIDFECFCEIRDHDFSKVRDHGSLSPTYIMRSIERYGRGSELAKYFALKYFPDAYDFVEIRRQWIDEDLLVACTEYATAVKDLVESNPPALSEKEVNNVAQVMNRLPSKEPFLGIRTSVKQAMAKAFPTSVPSTNAASKYIEWNSSGLVRSRSWLVTLGERSILYPPAHPVTNAMIYAEYLDRLHEDFDDQKTVTHEIAQLYCQFAIAFYRGGRYDLAEPLLEQIVLWRDDKGRPPEKRVYPMALYLLATLKVRNGDGPQALALAKDALDFLKKYPDADGRLIIYIFSFNRNIGETFSGNSANIGSLVSELVKTIRENPQAKFKNAYK